jgi:hypothetical protein
MSNPSRRIGLIGGLLFAICAVCNTGVVRADQYDPAERVMRLSATGGGVSYSPAGEHDWTDAGLNRPLIRGDRLSTDRDARAELQVGSAAIRLGPNTSFEILDLDDRMAQVQVSEGTISLSVRRLYADQIYEIDTPTLAFTVTHVGRYRIDVAPDGADTTIVVWEGSGEADGDRSKFPLRAGDAIRFRDAGLRDYEEFSEPPLDDFDRFCLDRDRRLNQSPSLHYVSDDTIGYSDLDDNGSWNSDQEYGAVWYPSHVAVDWAPYRDGHWMWQEPWGWTWVDNARWGFAPSHYGRWVHVRHRWGWIPGPRHERPIYAPALVVFVGGQGWSVAISSGSSPIGWFPLGPREVYVPSYHVSRNYFTRVNTNNTVINNTTIVNVYNNYSHGKPDVTQAHYVNRGIPGAITAVPSSVFVNARPVRQSAIRTDHAAETTGQVSHVAPFAPSTHSLAPARSTPNVRPPRAVADRPILVRRAPPPKPVPFEARERQLQRNPGRALEPKETEAIQARDKEQRAHNVRVIGAQPNAVNTRAAGPEHAAAPGPRRPLDRGQDQRKDTQPVKKNRNDAERSNGNPNDKKQ